MYKEYKKKNRKVQKQIYIYTYIQYIYTYIQIYIYSCHLSYFPIFLNSFYTVYTYEVFYYLLSKYCKSHMACHTAEIWPFLFTSHTTAYTLFTRLYLYASQSKHLLSDPLIWTLSDFQSTNTHLRPQQESRPILHPTSVHQHPFQIS